MDARIKIIQGDITQLKVDAIVNAANIKLSGGGGVDGAIHKAAGPELKEACAQLRRCRTGDAKSTKGFNLPARYIFHTVGPIWKGGEFMEENYLISCYRNCMHLGVLKDIRTIAFPNISTGAYGFPKEKAAQIALDTVDAFLRIDKGFDEVTFVCFDEENYNIYEKLIGQKSVDNSQ